jgi:GT2 family glycosyltransferase
MTATPSITVDDVIHLDVVIVNYNTSDLLMETLDDLDEHLPAPYDSTVYVVDNLSSDDSVDRMRNERPNVALIETGVNGGFCRGNNAGIRVGTGEYVLLVNTDTRLFPGTVEAMMDKIQSDPRIGAVGPRLEYADGRFQPAMTGAVLSLWSYFTWATGLSKLAERVPRLEGCWTMADRRRDEKVGWVASSCLLLRRSAIEEIGLMDERIFLYMDDMDLCDRLGKAGWSTWRLGNTRAVHFMSGGDRRAIGTISPHTVDSLVRWFERRYGKARTGLLRTLGVFAHGSRGLLIWAAYLREPTELRKDRALVQLNIARYFVRSGVTPPTLINSSTSTE